MYSYFLASKRSSYGKSKCDLSLKSERLRYRFLLLIGAAVSPTIIIIWGELSEFNINTWILPTLNVPQSFIDLEQVLIGGYYLLTPILLLSYFRGVSVFRNDNRRFLSLVLVCIFSFALLRYFDYLYDANGPPIADPFGNFYPLAFWILPLLSTRNGRLLA